jgi:hypothetical protein
MEFGIAAGAVATVLVSRSLLRRSPREIDSVILYLIILVGFGLISSITSAWIRPAFAYGGFAVGVAIMLYISLSIRDVRLAMRVVIRAVMVIVLTVVIASLAVEDFTVYRYTGLFHNPNSLGWFTATTGAFLAAVLATGYIVPKEKICVTFGIVALATLLMASNSRNGLGGLLIALCIITIPRLFRFRYRWRGKSVLEKRMFMVLAVTVVTFGVFSLIADLHSPLIEKFSVTHQDDALTRGRLDGWARILGSATLFGIGENYEQVLLITGLSGHSTYMSQLARYGAVPAVAYAFFLVWIFAKLMGAWRSGREIGAVGTAVLGCFLFMAAFETGSATPGVWLSTLMAAFTMSERASGQDRS